jgi:protein kinase X
LKKVRIVANHQLPHVQNEIQILSRLRCDFVIELRAVFQDENSLYLLLDYVPGGELFSYLRRDKKFDTALSQFYAVEVACAFFHLHKMNIIYRDLKPENILIDKIGHIRLTEFSLSKIINNRTYTMCGTPEYISPEIINGQGYGISSDWWALGILIHEMAVGYPPFFGRNPFTVYRKILNGFEVMDETLPQNLRNLLRGMLHPTLAKRLCSYEQVKSHAFFKGVDWNSAFQKLIVPLLVPTVAAEGDSSNYDYYPEEAMEQPANLTLEERKMFQSIDQLLDRASQI